MVENSSGADCWQWLGGTDKDGYGWFNTKKNGKDGHVRAHRIAWELRHGPILEELGVLHHCDNPGCVNPSHLFLGPPRINSEDMVAKNRSASGEKNAHAKLSWNDIPTIRLTFVAGASIYSLAKRYNVDKATMRAVLYNRTWRESDVERHSMEQFWTAMVR
jgi:hypothetical protein